MKIVNSVGFMLVVVLTIPLIFLGHILNLFRYSQAIQITFNPSKYHLEINKIK